MTKAMRIKYQQYLKSNKHNLYHCYKSFSHAKAAAWEYCEKLCADFNGMSLRVITFNQNVFTAGFTFRNKDNVLCFFLITPSKDSWYPIKDLID